MLLSKKVNYYKLSEWKKKCSYFTLKIEVNVFNLYKFRLDKEIVTLRYLLKPTYATLKKDCHNETKHVQVYSPLENY